MDKLSDKFYYVHSSQLSNRIQIKIISLDGKLIKPECHKLLEEPMMNFSGMCEGGFCDLMVMCQIFDQNEPVALPVITSYKAFCALDKPRWEWSEWLTLPVQYSDLPRTAQLAITIYDTVGPNKIWAVGGTTVSLFDKYGVLRQGQSELKVWRNREADGNNPPSTPGKIKVYGKESIRKLPKLVKKHSTGHIINIDWLDRMAFADIVQIIEDEKSSTDYMYLTIGFPSINIDRISHHIVYFEQNGDEVSMIKNNYDIVSVPDQEIPKENLVESKHHKLARSLRCGYSDKDAKPNAAMRDILNTIVSYPSTKQLTTEEQDHVWKFRFYLSSQKKALAKFLKCVNWNQQTEVRQALIMMENWSPMDVEDSLELLSPIFKHPAVRRYAVHRLQQAPDDEILLYMAQLIQALKYENFETIKADCKRISPDWKIPALIDVKEPVLEKKDSKESNSTITSESMMQRSSSYNQADQIASSNVNSVIEIDVDQRASSLPDVLQNLNVCTDSGNTDTLQSHIENDENAQDLASFLITRSCQNLTLANYFHWYLLLECEDDKVSQTYQTVMQTFSQKLNKGNEHMQNFRKILSKQQKFINKLVKLMAILKTETGNTKKKIERLQQLLADPDAVKYNFARMDPIPFPLDPEVIITGIIPEKATLFTSKQIPSKLHFRTIDNGEYVAMFKHGDDLRQDQLVLQMITLMDKLLKKENLDLKLTPYKVLATSTKHGFLQFIDASPVSDVVSNNKETIHDYFRKYYPQPGAPFGVAPDVIDTYIRSCAGYCVITNILGVGDRHLDNLLLTKDGKLFHIDFSYILGRDPKPMNQPTMRISSEMVDAMGGLSSEYFQQFRKLCYTAFLHLRRHANLMLNLFSLMVDASVPDIALEPDKAVKKVQDNLKLNLGDEEAVTHVQNLIDKSIADPIAAVVERFHQLTQYIRK